MRQFASIAAIALLAACSGGEADDPAAADPQGDVKDEPLPDAGANPARTRPAGEPRAITVAGRIEGGAECPVIRTPDGEVWSFSPRDAAFEPGDYVEISGEIADASICMQGQGHILPRQIASVDPSARDRDPARAGGIALTEGYITGTWVAKGAQADCERPNLAIRLNRNGGPVLETRVNGVPTDAAVRLGPDPAFVFDDPLPDTPIETRGPDGLAVLAPQTGEITIAGHDITGDGVVFVKCS